MIKSLLLSLFLLGCASVPINRKEVDIPLKGDITSQVQGIRGCHEVIIAWENFYSSKSIIIRSDDSIEVMHLNGTVKPQNPKGKPTYTGSTMYIFFKATPETHRIYERAEAIGTGSATPSERAVFAPRMEYGQCRRNGKIYPLLIINKFSANI